MEKVDDRLKAKAFLSKVDDWLPVVAEILDRGGTVRICPRQDGISILEVKNKQATFVPAGRLG